MRGIIKKFLTFAVFVLLLVYLLTFAYLNLAKYAQHVDSDIAAEALLAREIWVEKTLTPDDWIGSTERYIFGMPAVAALFYGITGSMTLAAGIACVLIGAVFCAVFLLFLKRLGLSKPAAATALLALCALPINGIRNDEQMVPFVVLLLFAFADYYALHAMLMFLIIMFYLDLKYYAPDKYKPDRKQIVFWAFLLVFTALISMGGQRCLQMVVLPMVFVEVLSLFVQSDFFSAALPKQRFLATGFVFGVLIAGLLGGMRKGQAQYAMFLNNAQETMSRIFITVPAAILEGFGIAGNAKVGNFRSIMQMLVWAFLALVVFGFCYIFIIDGKKSGFIANEYKRQKQFTDKVKQKEAVAILSASLGITAFIVAFTTAEAAHNYFLFAWLAAVTVVAVLIDRMAEKKSFLWEIILAAICLFAVLNLKYTYADAVTTTDNLKDFEEVADFMLDNGIEYGYAEFWDAERISLVRDGAVTMGCSYSMDKLEMYWWITSMKWYPPNLPEDMSTAYVVKSGKKDSFLLQFGDDSVKPELQFENQRFAVYVSDKNYMRIQ